MKLNAFNKPKDTIKNIKITQRKQHLRDRVQAALCLLGLGCSGGRCLLRCGGGWKSAVVVVVVEVEVGNGGDGGDE